MSTAAEPAPPDRSGDTRPDPEAALPPPEERGATTVSDRVVARVAAQAVSEVDRATGAPRVVLGQPLGGHDASTPARVEAAVDGRFVTVDVSMAVHWPAPVVEVTRQVRRHVTERVAALCGLEVVEVDIEVATLVTGRDGAHAPRVR